jgi:hypothetical protein
MTTAPPTAEFAETMRATLEQNEAQFRRVDPRYTGSTLTQHPNGVLLLQATFGEVEYYCRTWFEDYDECLCAPILAVECSTNSTLNAKFRDPENPRFDGWHDQWLRGYYDTRLPEIRYQWALPYDPDPAGLETLADDVYRLLRYYMREVPRVWVADDRAREYEIYASTAHPSETDLQTWKEIYKFPAIPPTD